MNLLKIISGFALLFFYSILFGIVNFNAGINKQDFYALIFILFAWVISFLLTGKYMQDFRQRYINYIIAPFIKSFFVSVFLLPPLFLVFDTETISKIFFLLLILNVSEIVYVSLWYLFHKNEYISEEYIIGPMEFKKPRQIDLEFEDVSSSFNTKLFISKEKYELSSQIIDFISEHIKSRNDDSGKGLILKKDNQFRDRIDGHYNFVYSEDRLNNIRRVGKFIKNCYNSLIPGGWFVLNYLPFDFIVNKYRKKMPAFLFFAFYPFYFIVKRVLPKIPWINNIYFSITKGRNRALSKTEVWGRLHYAGFWVIDEKEIDGSFFVIARKLKTPSDVQKPSYYPLIKLQRVGLKGKIITAFKIRSMYPFSEFLQQRIFEENKLINTGKISEDFRITGYGKIIRKYWLDELPQIFDWLKGNIKLVGIRAMSMHFFSLYSEEYQKLFIRVKPGLIPPIFDENTSDFSEIERIEKKYLESYLKNPVITDIKYFWETFSNIFFKGVRSK